nr:MAG TPA: hypothetical protein [Bacteriophage sp.]
MSLKKFLIELIELNTEYHVYKSAGLSDGAAFSCAHTDYENAHRASAVKREINMDEELAKIEERKQRLEKTKEGIANRRRELYEENPWLREEEDES